jgi:hypothetical protein
VTRRGDGRGIRDGRCVRTAPRTRSHEANAPGADSLDAERGEHRVKAGGELGVPVADEEPETLAGIFDVGSEVPCHLGHPWAVRVGGDTEDVDDASLQLDHEQHAVPAGQQSVDMEEGGGDDALGLGGEELTPSGALTSGSRSETVPAQDLRYARLRHRDTEFLEFADDPEVALPGVLPRQAADQLDSLFGKGWTTWSAVREGPVPADQRTVPSEDCLPRDEERPPELSGYESGQEGDEGTVGPCEAGTGALAAQHSQLVAQNKDLCILGRSTRPVDANDLEHESTESWLEANVDQ